MTESVGLFESRLALATIRVAVIVLSWWAVGANSSNPDISRLADTESSCLAIILIESSANLGIALLLILVIGKSFRAFRAGTLDDHESSSAITFSTVEVIDLINTALMSADTLVDIVELAFRAFCAEIVD